MVRFSLQLPFTVQAADDSLKMTNCSFKVHQTKVYISVPAVYKGLHIKWFVQTEIKVALYKKKMLHGQSEGNLEYLLCLLFRFSQPIMVENYYPLILRGNTSGYRLSFHTLIIHRRGGKRIINVGAHLLIQTDENVLICGELLCTPSKWAKNLSLINHKVWLSVFMLVMETLKRYAH